MQEILLNTFKNTCQICGFPRVGETTCVSDPFAPLVCGHPNHSEPGLLDKNNVSRVCCLSDEIDKSKHLYENVYFPAKSSAYDRNVSSAICLSADKSDGSICNLRYYVYTRLVNSMNVALVCGLPGHGKTTIAKHLTHLWAKGLLWPQFKFVFSFFCRELNEILNVHGDSITSTYDLIKYYYENILLDINVKDFTDMEGDVLIILDGLDELIPIKDICSRVVETKLNATLSKLMKGKNKHSLIMLGRPESCHLTKKIINSPFNFVETVGFSESSLTEYVRKYFTNENDQIPNKLLSIMSQSPQIKALARSPVIAHILCAVFQHDNAMEIPRTTTEVYIHGIIAILCKHFRGNLLNDELVYRLGTETKNALLAISNIAYQLRSSGRIVCEYDDEMFEKFKDFEKSGF